MRDTVLGTVLLLAACTGPATPPVPEVESDEPSTVEAPPPEPPAAPVVWRAAWPVDGGVSVADASADGRLLGPDGTTPAAAPTPCGSHQRFDGPGVLWLPPGEPLSFLKAPMVSAALVERSAWRLAEVAPPTDAIPAGIETPDPALHQGIRVRSVRKIRRRGPPFQLILGERDTDVLIAVTDRDAKVRKGGLSLTRASASPMRFGVIPPADLDGDGEPEIVVYGDGETGGFRAVLGIDLMRGRLTERSFEESDPVACH